jgi:hypothetical protein
MSNRQSSLILYCTTIFLLTALFLTPVMTPLNAQEKSSVAMVTGISKQLLIIHGGKEIKGKVGMDLFEGDILKTGEGCGAVLLLGDGSEVKMNQKTEITIKAFNSKQKNIFVKLGEIFGKFLPQQTKVIFETPRGIAGIEGTEFTIKVDDQAGMVNVREGTVSVGTDQKTKITGDKCCSFRDGTATQPFTAKFPEWHKEVKDYGTAVMEKFKEVTKDGNSAVLVKPPHELSRIAIEAFKKQNKEMGKELLEVTPPEFLADFHKKLIGFCEMRAETAEAALKAKDAPSDGALKTALLEKIKTLDLSKHKLRLAGKQAFDTWCSCLNEFKQSYMKRKGTTEKIYQRFQQHMKEHQGTRQQEN